MWAAIWPGSGSEEDNTPLTFALGLHVYLRCFRLNQNIGKRSMYIVGIQLQMYVTDNDNSGFLLFNLCFTVLSLLSTSRASTFLRSLERYEWQNTESAIIALLINEFSWIHILLETIEVIIFSGVQGYGTVTFQLAPALAPASIKT